MKQIFHKGSPILLLTILCFFSCKKSADPVADNPGGPVSHDSVALNSQVPYPVLPTPECDYAPKYAIRLFSHNQPEAVIISSPHKTIRE